MTPPPVEHAPAIHAKKTVFRQAPTRWRRGGSVLLGLIGCGLLLCASLGRTAAWERLSGVLVGEIGGTDINLITGVETSPNVTQDEAVVWAHGQTIVVVYNDSRGRNLVPSNICGVSVSTNGGATFNRLSPSPFTGMGECQGSPSLFYSVRAGRWYASFLASGCGGSGIGQWESADGVTWISSGCIANLSVAGFPRAWVDNNPGSAFYGRQYIAYNNFNVGGGVVQTSFSTNDGVNWSAPFNVTASFVRAVHLTGSLFADGTVFVQGMNEGGGGLNGMRSNIIYRSTNGGVNWSAFAQGSGFFGPGRASCSDNSYFGCMYTARWRELGWGQAGAGPGGVVHYAYTASPAAGGADDPGNIFYIRSADNGATWSTPLQLNTDNTTRAQWGPSLSVNAQGVVLVSWYDERNTTNTDPSTHAPTIERFARVSNDNGATWEGEMAISDVVSPVPLQADPGIVPSYTGLYNHAAFSDDGLGSIAYHPWTDGRVSINSAPQQDVFLDRIMVAVLPIIVTTLDDHDDGTCDSADCSLREAINAANFSSGTTLTFAPALAGVIQLNGALPTLNRDLAIIGPGPHLLTVRRNIGGNYRIFTISNGTASGPAVSLSGLTVSNGLASTGLATPNSGGGIANDRGSLDVSNCHITGNSSAPGSSTDGGGIFNFDGTLIVNNSTFSGNNAYYGGGISNRRNSGGTASVTVTNTTFVGNSAPNGFGGAIFNQGSGTFGAPGTAVMTLTNCTLSDNSATNSYGGAIYTAGVQPGIGSMTLTNCTLNGNSATNGGIFNYQIASSASVTLRNNIFRTGSAGANLVNGGGTITSQGHNLSNDNGGGFLTGPADQINTEPQLGLLAGNGGPTMTHALMSGSPAINTGNDALAPLRDQRGYARSGSSDKGAFEFNGIPPTPPAVISVVSRKLHNGMPYDIPLPLTGTPGVECRSGGASNDYQILVNFANPVTYTSASLSAGSGSVASSSGNGTTGITVNLTGITSAQTIIVNLAGVSDGTTTGDVNVPVGILVADTNGNRTVNATDIGQTKAQSGQPVGASNFRSDVNANGSINATDIGQVKAQSGASLP